MTELPADGGPRTTDSKRDPRSRSVAPLWVVDDPLFDQHRSRGYHPERPERLEAARHALARGVAAGVATAPLEARDATDEEIARAHDPAYLEALASLAGKHAALDADTFVSPASVAAARRAAGGAAALVDALVDRGGRGLALLRPPGHHATRARGMGFCLLNNAALAAHQALARGLGRVAVVDWDVHHGNGTQDIFWDDPRVLYVSLHQSPLYPGTGDVDEVGAGEARGTNVNVPLSPGAGDAVYLAAWSEIVLPVIEAHAPELIVVSAGFDAHGRDPLAGMELTDAGFARMARSLAAVADGVAGGRLAVLLEGGYDLSAIEGSLAATIRAVAGSSTDLAGAAASPEAPPEPLGARHRDEIRRARLVASERWRGL